MVLEPRAGDEGHCALGRDGGQGVTQLFLLFDIYGRKCEFDKYRIEQTAMRGVQSQSCNLTD